MEGATAVPGPEQDWMSLHVNGAHWPELGRLTNRPFAFTPPPPVPPGPSPPFLSRGPLPSRSSEFGLRFMLQAADLQFHRPPGSPGSEAPEGRVLGHLGSAVATNTARPVFAG